MSTRTGVGAVVVSAVFIATLVTAQPAGAAPPAAPSVSAPTDGAAATGDGAAEAASASMLAAMMRDLNLTEEGARRRLAAEGEAARVDADLRGRLGAAVAGSWFSADSGRLVAAVTDAAAAERVRLAGAVPQLVAHNLRQLTAADTALGRAAGRSAPDGVIEWFVDVRANTVVLRARPDALDAAARFVADSGADPNLVRVVAATATPRLLADIRGGDRFTNTSVDVFCSVGFPVIGGFVTAGHCVQAGDTVSGFNGVNAGVAQASNFPGTDFAWVQTDPQSWTPRPLVNRYSGTTPNVVVTGAVEAPIGASVCRSGTTTGWRCGIIEARDVTVTADGLMVAGLTRTSACAEHGDSGGPFLAGTQGQGTVSVGSGDCTFGGTTYFQPLLPILNTYGLTLLIGTPPTITSLTCAPAARGSMTCRMFSTSSIPITTIRWTWNGQAQPNLDDRNTVTMSCAPLTTVKVGVTVRNLAGPASLTISHRC